MNHHLIIDLKHITSLHICMSYYHQNMNKLTCIDNQSPLIAAYYVLKLEYVLVLDQPPPHIPALLPHLKVPPSLRYPHHLLLHLSLPVTHPDLQVHHLMLDHLPHEPPNFLDLLRLVNHQLLIEEYLDLLVRGDSKVVHVAEVGADHPVDDERVGLIVVLEVDVHVLVHEHVQSGDRVGVLEVREVVVREQRHAQHPDAEGRDGQQVGALDLQAHVEVVEHVVVRLSEGVVLELLQVLLLEESQGVVRAAA